MPRRIVAMAQNQSYWASIEADVQSYLEKAIPIRSPESVFEPMQHLTFAAPRTTASALCVAACELVSGDRSRAMAAASAVHLMHAAAYIHEHLPLTDRPRPRPKPKPTIQHKYNPNIELLTGDGIIPFGLELLARSMDLAQNNQDRVLRVIIEMSRASGSQGVVDGQYQELGTDHDVEYVCKKKEGELHACGAACGAILAGGTEEEIERLRKFGVYAGTVRGLMVARNNRPGIALEDKIEKLKGLALKELECFQGNMIAELIAGLVHDEPSLLVAAER
ncbi:heterodimeric geranylgeranyl pyrophosphate synthase small subunit chloroplastic [Phtheirospermum japonicum]|uniref:Heterodimeric geranylgeranyl pyrophosphate synthase small subunit chloroplastic n=1 Tax=Phtheirospermum japonicum TaxID=374723 RepID=A0A830B3E9_9LAMI|nr:heterodimeric geranylgeranyl pyrophosphate synthase small subunit chloroplastic [Phtheirospermum japonicum]